MSLFKEQDDFILSAFQDQFNHDSDENSDHDTTIKTSDEKAAVEDKVSTTEILEDESDGDLSAVIDLTEETEIDKNDMNQSLVVTISDDPPTLEQSTQSHNESYKILDQSEDYDFSLNVRLDGTGFQRISTTHRTTLKEALKPIIDELAAEGKSLVVYLDGNELPLDCSPESLNLRPGTILNALTISGILPKPCNSGPSITVRMQDGNRKHRIKEFQMNPTEPLLKLKQYYAKEFGFDSTEKITLFFDGDLVEDQSTPEEIELEDDCVIDVMVS